MQNLRFAHPFGYHRDHGCDRNPQAPDAGNSAHLIRVNGNPLECHIKLYSAPVVLCISRSAWFPLPCKGRGAGGEDSLPLAAARRELRGRPRLVGALGGGWFAPFRREDA